MAGTQDSVRSWLASWCGPSVSRWAGPPATRSIPLVTWVRESPTRSCPSPAREARTGAMRSEEHTSELQSLAYLVCRLLLEKKKKQHQTTTNIVEIREYY